MKCTLCNSEFECFNKLDCWCSSMPKIKIDVSTKNCICSNCLLKEMARLINDEHILLTVEQKDEISRLGIVGKLEQNVDFYINEEENFVFTKWYHLKRAYCCNNGCKHCPY